MTRPKKAQEYSPEEFDTVVALIRGDAGLRDDIEAITGQKLDGKSPRELFDLFLTLQRATEVQATVVRYGQARRAVRQTRVDLADPVMLPPATAEYVATLQAKVDEERRLRLAAQERVKALQNRPALASVPTVGNGQQAVTA
jgi:hypothetical protein